MIKYWDKDSVLVTIDDVEIVEFEKTEVVEEFIWEVEVRISWFFNS